MQKTPSRLLICAGLSALVLAGCSKTAAPGTPAAEPTTETSNTTGTTGSGSMTEAIEALKGGKSVICTYSTKDSPVLTTAKVKGKKSHIIVSNPADTKTSTEMISDTQYMYTWQPTQKTGYKMKLPTEEELKKMSEQLKTTPAAVDMSKPENLEALQKNGSQVDCNPGEVSDSEFVVPGDVKFQDYTETMNNALEKAKAGMTEEQKKQMEDAMKQYQK